MTVLNTSTNQTQTWLIYLQPPDAVTPTLPELVFSANYNGSGANILTAQSAFNGFVRLGIVQPSAVPFSPQPAKVATEVADWSTALGIQTIATSPAGMFMLWPVAFTAGAKTKIEYNFTNQIDLPWCPWLSIYLPLVACTDFATASNYFYDLMADIPPPANHPYPFDGGTNPFLSYLYMLLATNYETDIATYQSAQRQFPSYGITATAQTIESAYDSYRDVVPTSTEVAFGSNTYHWTYATIIRQGSGQAQPLIIFPGYKTLMSPSTAVAGFLVQDPIKGPLYATAASGNQAFFQEGVLPGFLTTQFFPSDFWTRIGRAQQTILVKYLNQALANQALAGNITAISAIPDGYGNGKVLYQAAETILYGAALMQQQGMTPAAIKTATQPTINAIQGVIEDWLINIQTTLRAQQGGGFPSPFVQNFFIGDNTVGGGGVCYSIRGMLAGSNSVAAGQDFGNAFYNDHHFAYGYWLGAAALVMQWDNIYGPIAPNAESVPWIATTFTSGSGMGPFKLKSFIDILWRDTRNPDPNDGSLPYNRHGNMWEGHSTANGLALAPYAAGRNQESLAEDFNGWLATLTYANAVLSTNASFSGALSVSDTQGFSTLVEFCSTNLAMTATAGNLYYNTPNWPYANSGFNFNAAVGQQFDNFVDTQTFFLPGTPPCNCNSQTILNEENRFEDFYEAFFEF